MTRELTAFTALTAALIADASAQIASRQESPFSEFVYEVLGATPSLQLGRRTAKAVAPEGLDAAKVGQTTGKPEMAAAMSPQRDPEARRATERTRSAQE